MQLTKLFYVTSLSTPIVKPNIVKIDFLINKMSGGGAERVVSLLANYFSEKEGYSIRIITFTGTDNYELNSRISRIKLHNHPLFHSVTVNGFFSLLYFYRKKENRPDIISSHIGMLAYLTVPVAKFYGVKNIISEHINHSINNTLAKKIVRTYFYPMANAVTILTNYDLPYFKARHHNVWLLPNPSTFNPKTNEEIHQKENSSKKCIIAIGDLNRYHHKGFDNLITIADKVLNKHRDWTLKIVGGGDYGLTHLKNLVKNTSVKDRIEFMGFRTDIKNLLSNSDIYILPSRFEGLPMTLLEAMSQGTCCIAYNCISGPSDIITNEVNGLLIEDQNIEAMVSGLNKLIENSELRLNLKEKAPAALERFSMENISKIWIELFESLLQKR